MTLLPRHDRMSSKDPGNEGACRQRWRSGLLLRGGFSLGRDGVSELNWVGLCRVR